MNNLKQLCMMAMAFVVMLTMFSCEKMVLDEEERNGHETTEGNVIIRASLYNIVPFETRAEQNVADYCSHLQFVLYKDGTKMKAVNQKTGDSDYGQVAMTLQPDTYQLLVLAHSCAGNPTISDPTKIQFTNQTSYSDTFCYYGELEVKEGQNNYEVRLQRATSMVRVTVMDEIPTNVKSIRLYYEGESGVLNATTCMGGTTNSKQYVMFNVEGRHAPLTFGAYTFLRNVEGSLNMTITAYDSGDNIVAEKQLDNIPMKYRMVTEYSGNLFSVSNNDVFLNLTANTEWEVFREFTF